jgi:hypothetical protein
MPIFFDEDEYEVEEDVEEKAHNDEDIDTSYDLSKSKFVNRIRTSVITWMDVFFKGESYWAGGSIPRSKLFKEEHIKVVMEMNVMDAFAIAYYCLERNPPDTVNTKEKDWDVDLCYGAYCRCDLFNIPKCHKGGMVLVYLSVCHGVDFLPTLKRLAEIKAMFAKKDREEELEQLMKEQQEEDSQ